MALPLQFAICFVVLGHLAGAASAQTSAPPGEPCELVPRPSDVDEFDPMVLIPERTAPEIAPPPESEPVRLVPLHGPPTEAKAPSPVTNLFKGWYGYQLVLTDLASTALILKGQPEAGLVVYIGAPMTVHALHKQTKLMGASAALRLVLPVLALIPSHHEDRPHYDPWTRIAVGMAVAMVIDWCLARAKPMDDLEASSGPPPRQRTISLSGGISPTRDGAQVVLGGRF